MNPGSNSKLLAVIDGGPVGDLIREFGTQLQALGIVIVSAVIVALGIKLAFSSLGSGQQQGGGLRQTVGSLGTVIIAVLLIGAAFIVVPILFSTVGV